MNFRSLPSLTALRAFEASARLGSFKQAAEELGVTPAAVRAHIKSLETQLDSALFERQHKRITVTEPAERLQKSLHTAFSTMTQAVIGFESTSDCSVLVLGVGTLFASRWLSPKLSDYLLENPEISLRLVHSPSALEFISAGTDAAIIWGEGNWPELSATAILRPRLVAVAAPAYFDRYGRPKAPSAIAEYKLIIEDTTTLWEQWLATTAATHMPLTTTTMVRDGVLAMQLALDGQGILLAVEEFIQPELKSGQLIALSEARILGNYAYYFLTDRNCVSQSHVSTFKHYLLSVSEASSSVSV